jgi:hypothetical protein
MNRTDFNLQRLYRAAAASPSELPAEAPFALETRIMASWRSSLRHDAPRSLVPVFRVALLSACAIILISIGLSLRSLDESPPNEMFVVDRAIQLTLMQ